MSTLGKCDSCEELSVVTVNGDRGCVRHLTPTMREVLSGIAVAMIHGAERGPRRDRRR